MARTINTKSANIIDRTPALTAFLAAARNFPQLSESEVRTYIAGTEREKNKVVESYSLFMVSLASKFAKGDEILELVSLASIGMKKAMESFDPSMGTKFISYAVHYMYMEISNYFRGEANAIRRSSDAKLGSKVNRVSEKFYAGNGRMPSEEEIVEILKSEYGIEAKEMDVRHIRVSSINEQVSSDEDSATADEIGEIALSIASANDYEKEIEAEQNSRLVSKLLATLTPMERNVVSMLFGINEDSIEYGLDEIAEKYGLTSERVRQIKVGALKKLSERKQRVLATM